jgi:tetratricopeptide (TPR) repeat protein
MVSNWYVGIGSAHFQAGRYEQAVEWQEKALSSYPAAAWMYRGLIPSYFFAGHLDKAKASLGELLRAYPGLTIANVRAAMDFNKDYTARLVEGLRQAGLPE